MALVTDLNSVTIFSFCALLVLEDWNQKQMINTKKSDDNMPG
jgi:hypothetical protein